MILTEQQKNCPYCHTASNGEPLKYLKNNEDCSIFLTGDELHIRALKGYTKPSMLQDVNYCPKCGRNLNEKSSIRERKCFECNGTVTHNSGDTLLSFFFDDREKKNFIVQRHFDYEYSFRYNLLFDFCMFCGRSLNEEEESGPLRMTSSGGRMRRSTTMTNVPVSQEVSFTIESPKAIKDLVAVLSGCERISPIKRTRKRQIERAKFMDHTGYEWSQWWHKTARKSKRWKK